MVPIVKYLLAFGIVGLNMLSLCLYHVNWSWNLTAWIRLIAPVLLFIFLDPVVAMIIVAGVLDSVEPRINRNNPNYHFRDKKLDLWGYFVAIITIWLKGSNTSLYKYRYLLTLLFVYRAIGNLTFIATGKRHWLSKFPNWYEVAFIALPIIEQLPSLVKYKYLILVFLCILKLAVECVHHNSGVRDKVTPFRFLVKSVCPGKYTMYKETGTYPVDPENLYSEAPLFQ